jgi:hypothetical protein
MHGFFARAKTVFARAVVYARLFCPVENRFSTENRKFIEFGRIRESSTNVSTRFIENKFPGFFPKTAPRVAADGPPSALS